MQLRRFFRAALVASTFALIALSPVSAILPSYTLDIGSPPITIGPGEVQTAQILININSATCVRCSNGALGGPANDQCCPGDFTVSVSNVPPGVEGCLLDGLCLPSVQSDDPQLILSAGPDAVPGVYQVKVESDAAVGPTSQRHKSDTLELTVAPFSIAVPDAFEQLAGTTQSFPVSMVRGTNFVEAVTFQLVSPHPGITANFQVDPATGDVSSYELSVEGTVADGAYPLDIVATSATASRTFRTFANVRSAFQLRATPSSLDLVAGQTVSTTIAVKRDRDFSSRLSFSAFPSVAGLAASFSDAAFGGKTLHVSVDPSVAPGTYLIRVSAQGGGVTKDLLVAVRVHRFLLHVAAESAILAPGTNISIPITITRATGFTSAISFSVPELPAQEVSASFTPVSTTGDNSTLRLSASRFADGVEGLIATITATAGAQVETQGIGVEVIDF